MIYTDEHTLYIKCGCATEEQMYSCVRETFMKYKVTSNFKVNIVMDRDGNSLGLAFVFIADSSIYHMLLGKNKDGSARVKYERDPGWKPEQKPVVVTEYDKTRSWADLCLEEEAEEEKIPVIEVALPPLMEFLPINLSKEQIEIEKASNSNSNSNADDKIILYVDRALVKSLDENVQHNILKAKGVPKWVIPKDIINLFKHYSKNKKYPVVNITSTGILFITFDPSTREAQFALHMMKKTVVKKGAKKVTLVLTHSTYRKND